MSNIDVEDMIVKPVNARSFSRSEGFLYQVQSQNKKDSSHRSTHKQQKTKTHHQSSLLLVSRDFRFQV